MTKLEHVNVTVKDAKATALWMSDVFDWKIRWEGAAIHGGTSVHVGGADISADSYLALYSSPDESGAAQDSYTTQSGLNHIGVVVADLDETEKKVLALGYDTHSHADYTPGRRFYFCEENGIEIEVVAYVATAA